MYYLIIHKNSYESADLPSPATSCITASISLAMTLASSPLFFETETDELPSIPVSKGKVVAAVARPRLTAGKLKKEPRSRLKRFGRAKRGPVVEAKIRNRRQT